MLALPLTPEPARGQLVDVRSVEATIRLDVGLQRTSVQARLRFASGHSDAPALFDLRQTPIQASLNGETAPWQVVRLNGSYPDRLVDVGRVMPCAEHTVELTYEIVPPHSLDVTVDERRRVPAFQGGTVWWTPWLSDLTPGSYLESWLPAGLQHDDFMLTLTLEVVGTSEPHDIWTNGETVESSFNRKVVAYPSHFTSLSPFWLVAPSQTLAHMEATTRGGVPVVVVGRGTSEAVLADGLDTIRQTFEELETRLGPYPHQRFLAYLVEKKELPTSRYSGMEYDGAAISVPQYLRHEVIHSWIGRGIRPFSGASDWTDEAMTVYLDTRPAPAPMPELPPTLMDPGPWARGQTPHHAYSVGPLMFAAIAHAIGEAALEEALASLYRGRVPGTYTAEDLRRALYCPSQSEEVLRLFHTYVDGRDPDTPWSLPDCSAP